MEKQQLFACNACGMNFESKDELDVHNTQAHPSYSQPREATRSTAYGRERPQAGDTARPVRGDRPPTPNSTPANQPAPYPAPSGTAKKEKVEQDAEEEDDEEEEQN